MKTKIFITTIVIGLFTVSTIHAQEKVISDTEVEMMEKATYTCSMHPEVKMDQPGDCPKCGMELIKMDKGKETYSCSMHSEVISDKPGNCSKCSMGLIKMDKESNKMIMNGGEMTGKYICPMKCEGEKKYMKNGSCPVCNMKLKKLKMSMKHKGDHMH